VGDLAWAFFWLVVFLFVILAGADVFTNSLEWLGQKLQINEGVLGSILAAVGTAMPETLIPIVAVVFAGGAAAAQTQGAAIGVGAILGAPFMLSTLAMFVTGLTAFILVKRRDRPMAMQINLRLLRRDMNFFLCTYGIGISAAFLPVDWPKPMLAALLLAAYAYYVYLQITDGGAVGEADDLSPLHLARRNPNPPLWVIIGQVIFGLALIVGGAYFFVENIKFVSTSLGVPSVILALVIAPFATELPEKINSILWVRRGKDTLALGNITGAMVFQSCIPIAFGLTFTNWNVNVGDNRFAFLSATVTIISSIYIISAMRLRGRLSWRTLMISGGGYFVYLAALIVLINVT
jgi:cation:H+ antiporter